MNKFETNDYQVFLEELQNHTFIEQIILDNLIKTNLINNIFENKDAVFVDYENDTFYFNYSSLKNDYLNLLEFSFFKHFCFQSDYTIYLQKYINDSYIAYAYHKKHKHIISLFKDENTFKFHCNLFFQLDIDYSDIYTSDILNFKEIHSIIPYFFDYLAEYHKNLFFVEFKSFDIPFISWMTFDNIYSIDSNFDNLKIDYNNIMKPIKFKKMQILDKYYEPAILRLKLNDF